MLGCLRGKEKKLIAQSEVRHSMVASPAAANGVLYVATGQFLYALHKGASIVQPAKLESAMAGSDWLDPILTKQRKPLWRRVLTIGGISACVVVGIAIVLRLSRRKLTVSRR